MLMIYYVVNDQDSVNEIVDDSNYCCKSSSH